jgi:hypothetical protein
MTNRSEMPFVLAILPAARTVVCPLSVARSSSRGIGDGLLPGGIVVLQTSKVVGIAFAAADVAIPKRWRQYCERCPGGNTE